MIFQNVLFAYHCEYCASDVCKSVSPGSELRYCEGKECVLVTEEVIIYGYIKDSKVHIPSVKEEVSLNDSITKLCS
jgi:hypothetical protein